LLSILAETDRLPGDRSIPLPECSRMVAQAGRDVDEVMQRLAGRVTTANERRYVDAVAKARDARRAEYTESMANAERATGDALRKLRGLRVPAQAQAGHAALVEAAEGYRAAAERFHRAWQPPDPDGAASAAADAEAAWAAMRAAGDEIVASLDYRQRWSVAAQDTSTD